jgi:hypothetical protein
MTRTYRLHRDTAGSLKIDINPDDVSASRQGPIRRVQGQKIQIAMTYEWAYVVPI